VNSCFQVDEDEMTSVVEKSLGVLRGVAVTTGVAGVVLLGIAPSAAQAGAGPLQGLTGGVARQTAPDSPGGNAGVGSGNRAEVPADARVEACGNTLNILGSGGDSECESTPSPTVSERETVPSASPSPDQPTRPQGGPMPSGSPGPRQGDELPVTGSSLLPLLGGTLVFVLAGTALVVMARRRRLI
jgi:hypothetical protein